MRKGWIWGGFGVLLTVAVLSGFVPDLQLAAELRKARQEGLLDLPATRVDPAHDAHRAFRKALLDNQAAAERIRLHPESRGWDPNASTVRFIGAVVSASELPGSDRTREDPFSVPEPPPSSGRLVPSHDPDLYVAVAAEEIEARAKDEADLLRAARIARLLDRENDVHDSQIWAGLANALLDRAKSLNVPERSLVEELGPPPDARRILQRRFARVVAGLELDRTAGKAAQLWGVGSKRAELGYIRYWRGFFRQATDEAALVRTLGAEALTIDAQDRKVTEAHPIVVFGVGALWTGWAAELDRLRARMEAVR